MNFKGSEAQVAVRQLVNEIMQREGNKRMLADPNERRKVEERVIFARGSVQDLLDERVQTPREQINAALSKSNEVKDEQAFPELGDTEPTEASAGVREHAIPQQDSPKATRTQKANAKG